jgi:hypothetical protein
MDARDREPDSTADGENAARWMSFAELSAARGISKASAIKLVRRHGWRRQRDNQGHVRALVPLTWTEREGDAEPDRGRDSTPDIGLLAGTFETALAAIEAAHARELATLKEQVAGAEAARIAMQALVQQFAGQMHDADEAFKLERERAAAEIVELRVDLDAANARAQEALQSAEAVRRAEAERKARGLVARLRAALRGE